MTDTSGDIDFTTSEQAIATGHGHSATILPAHTSGDSHVATRGTGTSGKPQLAASTTHCG